MHHRRETRTTPGCFQKFPSKKDIDICLPEDHQTIGIACVTEHKSSHCLWTFVYFWNYLRTIDSTNRLDKNICAFDSEVKCIKLKVLEGFDKNSSLDHRAWIVKGLFCFDVNFKLRTCRLWVPHFILSKSNVSSYALLKIKCSNRWKFCPFTQIKSLQINIITNLWMGHYWFPPRLLLSQNLDDLENLTHLLSV